MKSEDCSIFQRFLIRFPANFSPALSIYWDKIDGCMRFLPFLSEAQNILDIFLALLRMQN
jgi:hypothetical protein